LSNIKFLGFWQQAHPCEPARNAFASLMAVLVAGIAMQASV